MKTLKASSLAFLLLTSAAVSARAGGTAGAESFDFLLFDPSVRAIGLGGAYTLTTEHVLFCRRGTCPALSRVDSTWWEWRRGRHSAKPDAFLDLVERVSPPPRLELFARTQRLGWDTWGNECLNHVTL